MSMTVDSTKGEASPTPPFLSEDDSGVTLIHQTQLVRVQDKRILLYISLIGKTQIEMDKHLLGHFLITCGLQKCQQLGYQTFY